MGCNVKPYVEQNGPDFNLKRILNLASMNHDSAIHLEPLSIWGQLFKKVSQPIAEDIEQGKMSFDSISEHIDVADKPGVSQVGLASSVVLS